MLVRFAVPKKDHLQREDRRLTRATMRSSEFRLCQKSRNYVGGPFLAGSVLLGVIRRSPRDDREDPSALLQFRRFPRARSRLAARETTAWPHQELEPPRALPRPSPPTCPGPQ